ncbi:MAG: YicC family protein [Ruminococcaceae bacterium]|nr:YicC family protein [Oscillospiraceae bacterium]
MFKSMTAFGRERADRSGKDITVEIKSVNNRYFDCSVKLPHIYAPLEQRIKQRLSEKGISRGKVDVGIFVDFAEATDTEILVNREYAQRYINALKALKEEFGLSGEITVMEVARDREVFSIKKPEGDMEAEWLDLCSVLDVAIDRFIEARRSEGERIEKDLCAKIEGIRARVEKIEAASGDDIGGYKSRLEEKLRAALADNNITMDENRILTECAIYADRAAIDEEIVRLKSHFDAFYGYVAKDEPVGRSLDFLIQEMNREINTVGSKCGNSSIAHLVVECKTEMEKVREQIQNIE